jgi:hypothetical protein
MEQDMQSLKENIKRLLIEESNPLARGVLTVMLMEMEDTGKPPFLLVGITREEYDAMEDDGYHKNFASWFVRD